MNMSMETLKRIMYILYKSKVPLLMQGMHGVGKTSAFYQLHAEIRKELGQDFDHCGKSTISKRSMVKYSSVPRDEFGLWTASAQNMTKEELIGNAIVSGDRKSVNYVRSSQFIPPADHVGGGIWNIDEINLGHDVMDAIMSLALEGHYLDYVLPDGIWVCISQNPSIGEYTGRDIAPQTVDRFCAIPVLIENKSTIEHFIQSGFDSRIVDSISRTGYDKMLNPHQNGVFESISFKKVPTSRAWEFVNMVIPNMTKAEAIGDIGNIIFTGLVGETAMMSLRNTMINKDEDSIVVDDIINKYGCPIPIEKSKSFDDWAITKTRANVINLRKKTSMRFDIFGAVLSGLMLKLRDMAVVIRGRCQESGKNPRDEITDNEISMIVNIIGFLLDSPPEIAGNTYINDIQKFSVKEKINIYDYTLKCVYDYKVCKQYIDSWKNISDNVRSAAVSSAA